MNKIDKLPRQTSMLLRQGVNKLSKEMEWDLHKSFKKVGCSCHPLRDEMGQVQAECDRLKLELEQTPPFQRFQELRNKIGEIDANEHPNLNRMAKQAVPFFRVWLFQQLIAGNSVVLGDYEGLGITYAQDWLNGWRPVIER